MASTISRSDKRRQFEGLVAELHADHPRGDQFMHCQEVADLLEKALELEGIYWPDSCDMVLAALGHDLYEDVEPTPITPVSEFGPRVHELISALTEDETLGVLEYVERVATGPEEVILIKLCDGISNYGGLASKDKLRGDGAGELEKNVKQKMEPMFSRLEEHQFSQYPIAGAFLSGELNKRRRQFWEYAEELL